MAKVLLSVGNSVEAVLLEKDFASAVRILISNCFIGDGEAELIFKRLTNFNHEVITDEECIVIHRYVGKQLTACIYDFATNNCRRELLNIFLKLYGVIINASGPVLLKRSEVI